MVEGEKWNSWNSAVTLILWERIYTHLASRVTDLSPPSLRLMVFCFWRHGLACGHIHIRTPPPNASVGSCLPDTVVLRLYLPRGADSNYLLRRSTKSTCRSGGRGSVDIIPTHRGWGGNVGQGCVWLWAACESAGAPRWAAASRAFNHSVTSVSSTESCPAHGISSACQATPPAPHSGGEPGSQASTGKSDRPGDLRQWFFLQHHTGVTCALLRNANPWPTSVSWGPRGGPTSLRIHALAQIGQNLPLSFVFLHVFISLLTPLIFPQP